MASPLFIDGAQYRSTPVFTCQMPVSYDHFLELIGVPSAPLHSPD